MKIVILEKEEGLGIGGIVMHNKRLSDYLKKQGHEVVIVRFSNVKRKRDGILSIPYHIAEKRTFIFVPSQNTKRILTRHLRKIKPDVVHFCLGISPFDYFVPTVCHELKIPVLGIWHGDLNSGSDAYSLLIKSIFTVYLTVCRQLDGLIVFSQKMKDFHVERGIDQNRVFVIPNGIDTKIYSPGRSEFKKDHKIATGILFLGRLTFVKHPEILIESFLSLNTPPDTKLVIVGTGDMEQELKETYQDKRLIFTGLISDEKQKADMIRGCDIFVLPSVYEGMSLALLEGMSTGLACVASNVGANPDLVDKSGITINHQKIKQELPIVLRILLDQPKFAKELGKKARERVSKQYSVQKCFSAYTQLYRQTLLEYQKRGYPKTTPIDLNLAISKRLKTIWKKAKELGTTYLFGED